MNRNSRQDALIKKTETVFLDHFGKQPVVRVQAPGRVNLIGEHTDYNDGFVLPCAIDYQTVVSAAPRADWRVNVVAVDFDNESDSFDLTEPVVAHPDKLWSNYIRGMVKHLQYNGFEFTGADIVVSGNVPQGAGLSSSAALEVAIGQTFKTLYELELSQQKIALIAQQAENQFVGCNCGIMDQLVSAKGEEGSAMLLDCRSLDTRAVAIPEDLSIVVINSNVKRGLVDTEYNLRRQQCEQAAKHFNVSALRDVSIENFNAQRGELDPVVAKRARHVISENARVLAAADALSSGDIIGLAELMGQSHISMRDDFEITVPAVDTLVDIVKQVVGDRGGVRMTGGGFGGCVVAIIPSALLEYVDKAIQQQYQSVTGIKETFYICQAASGAGEIQ